MSRKALIKSKDEYKTGMLMCLIGGIVYSFIGIVSVISLCFFGEGGWIGLIPLGFGTIALVGWIGTRLKYRWGMIFLIMGSILNPISTKGVLRVKRAIKFIEEWNKENDRGVDHQKKRLDSDTASYKQAKSPASTTQISDKCINCGQKIPYSSDKCPHCGFPI